MKIKESLNIKHKAIPSLASFNTTYSNTTTAKETYARGDDPYLVWLGVELEEAPAEAPECGGA